MKIIIILTCFLWQSIYLFYATRIYFNKKVKKPTAIKYEEVPLRQQQLMIIGVMSELLQAGIDPLSVIKSGLETLEEEQRQKYQDQLSGKQIDDSDHLISVIDLILRSSISGSKISETLRLNMESIQRSHRSEVLKAIKKSEVWLLGPLGLCLLPTFMLIAVVPLIGSLITGFMS
jgi:hypothetical protein